MSLRNVHVVFIVAATLLAVLSAVQAFGSFRANGSLLTAAGGAGALAWVLLLLWYEARFLRWCRAEGIR